MKTLNVVAAIIESGENVLITKRSTGMFKHKWEFPGGKIEVGETPQQALKREIFEELQLDIAVGELFTVVEYDYPDFHLSMQCFLCTTSCETIKLTVHEAAKWIRKEEIDTVDWLLADIEVVEKYKKRKK